MVENGRKGTDFGRDLTGSPYGSPVWKGFLPNREKARLKRTANPIGLPIFVQTEK
jgi:hypothetical protein